MVLIMIERTLIIIKPDGVRRKLVGEVIRRYEQGGLKVVAMKMLKVSQELISRHYTKDEGYLISLGKKSEKAGDAIKDYRKQGLMIVHGLRKYMTEGPVVAIVLKGENAIKRAREITGYTDPSAADKGTIRGDFGEDNILEANRENRPVRNLIHASGNPDEAGHEISLWFPEL